MNLDKFADLLLEGGQAVGEVSRVSKENVEPTIEAFDKEILQKLGITNFTKIGSTGKKSSSGDLDIAVELPEDLDYKEVHSQIKQMGYEISKASPTTISVKFPIYSQDGETDEWAQVDMMFGKTDWLEFGYYAPAEGESKYTGAHRNFLLAAIIRYARELKGREGKTWAIDLNRGLNRKTRGTKLTKTGKEKEVVLAKTLITQRPEKVVDLLNITTDGDWELSDLKAPFEHLWQKTKKAFPEDVLDKIREYVSGASKSSKKEEPVMEQLVKKLAEEILYEADRDGVRDRDKELDTGLKKKVKEFRKRLLKEFEKAGATKGNSKYGEDLRVQIQNTDINEEWIKNTVDRMGYSNAKVEKLNVKDTEARSRSLPTIKIELDNKINVYVVLSGDGQLVNRKTLTPKKLNLEEKYWYYDELYSEVESKIKSKGLNKFVEDYLLGLIEAVDSSSITYSKKITIDKDLTSSEDMLGTLDINNIQNDFGEILGAMAISKALDDNVFFPSSASEPLIDYWIGDTSYSAKSKGGAAPTLTMIAKSEYRDEVLDDMVNEGDLDEEDRETVDLVFDSLKSGVERNYLEIAKHIDGEAWKAFTDIMEDDSFDVENIDGKDFKEKIKSKLDEYYDKGVLEDKIKEFYNKINFSTAGKVTPISEYDKGHWWRYGYVIFPIASRVRYTLEKSPVLEAVKRIINLYKDVKQIDLYNEEDKIEFIIKNFSSDDIEVSLLPGGSIKAPGNQNIRFKLK